MSTSEFSLLVGSDRYSCLGHACLPLYLISYFRCWEVSSTTAVPSWNRSLLQQQSFWFLIVNPKVLIKTESLTAQVLPCQQLSCQDC